MIKLASSGFARLKILNLEKESKGTLLITVVPSILSILQGLYDNSEFDDELLFSEYVYI